MHIQWMYIDTWRSGGLRHGDVSAPAARRMVRTLVWPPLPHRTLANIGPLCPSLSFSSSLPCPPPFLAFSLSLSSILSPLPLCLARHVSRFDSGTFRCCVVTRVMHRNFKGPRHREISPPECESVRWEGTTRKRFVFYFQTGLRARGDL